MPQIGLLCVLLCLLLPACGSGSGSGVIFSETGHPSGWADPLSIGTADFHGTVITTVPSATRGAVLFRLHCGPCHGNDASGRIGPDIRGATTSRIAAAISAVPLMRGHSILDQSEINEIAGYLVELASGAMPSPVVFDPAACRECHGPDLDGGISRISCFSCHNGPDGSTGHPASWSDSAGDPVHYHGPYGRDFTSSCTTCHGFDLNGWIGPACSSCHNGTIAPVL